MDRNLSAIAVLLAAVVGTANAFGVYLFSILYQSMSRDLALDYWFVGSATGACQLAVTVGSLCIPYILSRFGLMGVLKAQFIALTIGLVAMGLTPVRWPILLIMPMFGFVAAGTWIAATVFVHRVLPMGVQGKTLGLIAATGTASAITLSALGLPTLLSIVGWRGSWLVAAAVCALILLAFNMRLSNFKHDGTKVEEHVGGINFGRLLRSTIGRQMIVLGVLNGLTYIPYQTFLVTFLQSKAGWTTNEAIYVWAGIGLGSMIGGFLFGVVTDHASARGSLLSANALSATSILILIYSRNILVLYVTLLVFGIAYGAVFGQTAAYIARIRPSSQNSVLNSVMYFCFGLGSAAGNLLIGATAGAWSSLTYQYHGLLIGQLCLIAVTMSLEDDRPRVAATDP